MRIIESGHFYQSKGPTEWSQVGWSILESLRQPDDKTLLFIDDIHPLDNVSEHEIDLPVVKFSIIPDYLIFESRVAGEAEIVLDQLKNLPRKNRAKVNGGGMWFCSGFPITDPDGKPACVLLDAGLTYFKSQQCDKALNILPYFYEEEQVKLLRLIRKAIPDFSLEVILYDLDGSYRKMTLNN